MRYELVDGFRFSHEPRGHTERAGGLIGREAILDRLATRIARSDGGSFLLVGYRGVGKTSLTNALIKSIAAKTKGDGRPDAPTELVDISFSLARPIPSANLLYQIINGMRLELKRRGLYDRLLPALRQEIDLAAMRTAAAITRTSEDNVEASFGLAPVGIAALTKLDIGGKATRKQALEAAFLPYDQCAAEQDAIRLSRALTAEGIFRPTLLRRALQPWHRNGLPRRLRFVFVFDELDKLEEANDRSGVLAFESILGNLKTLLTSSGATFVFVAGRGLHDAWEKDIGRGDSIFESVFSHVEYIPAVWDISARMCDALVCPPPEPEAVSTLDTFKRYLAYRGRGIPRRTLRAFHDFVRVDGDGRATLTFDPPDFRRFRCLAALEDCLAAAERKLLEARGGRRESDRHDRDALALRYLADWIVDRGQEPFGMAELIEACNGLNRMVAPGERSAPIIADALIRVLEGARFLESADFDVTIATVRVSGGTPIKTWRVPRQRLIELGRDLSAGASGVDGETLAGRYLMKRLIARGGMATVHEATDLHTQRSVAVKYVRDAQDAAGRALLRSEMEAMAKLDHPRLPRLLDAQLDAETPFIVLELIEGVTLHRLVRDGHPMPWQAAVAICRQILDVLAYVHAREIPWGDLKPSNVMIEPGGHVRLLDFGVFRNANQTGGEFGGSIVGTPRYMAPECLRGQPPSTRSDIYSFGVLAYQLTTGTLPFDGKDLDDVVRAATTTRPQAPAARATMPAALSELILRCLEPDPRGRYASAEEIAGDLPPVDPDDPALRSLLSAEARAYAEDVRDEELTVVAGGDEPPQPAPQAPTAQPPPYVPPAAMPEAAQPVIGGPPAAAQPHDVGIFAETGDKTIFVGNQTVLARPAQGPPPSPPLRVEVVDAAGTRHVVVSGSSATIGRAANNDIVINDSLASRYHARIERRRDGWTLHNLNAANGVIVNDKLLHDVVDLVPGTVIRIGASRIAVTGTD